MKFNIPEKANNMFLNLIALLKKLNKIKNMKIIKI